MAVLVAVTPVSVCAADPTPAPVSNSVPGIQTIALFQAANDAGASGEIAASKLDQSVQWRLNASGTYQVTAFSPRLPAIQRATTIDSSDANVSDSDIQQFVQRTPDPSPASAQRIAKVMSTDGFLIEEIDAYKADSTTGDVSITVSGSLFNTSTGIAARTFAVTGVASPVSADESNSSVMLRATDSAAAQIATTLGAGAPQGKTILAGSKVGGGGSIGTGILIVLAAALAGIIAHNVSTHSNTGSSNSGATVTTTTPPTNNLPPAPP
jgi:hypothetical protein